jgi:hypothetical protein
VALVWQRQAGDLQFQFLVGGCGETYYKWALRQMKAAAAVLVPDPATRASPLDTAPTPGGQVGGD